MIERMFIQLRNVFLKAGTYFVLFLISATIPTTSLARSSMTGFQGAMSFSCNSHPSNFRSKKYMGRATTVKPEGRNGRNPKHGLGMRKKESRLMVLGGPPMEDLGGADNRYSRLGKSFEFETALAIVPPADDWDRLQRARHFARDPVFREWPPAIRLFHPFDSTPDLAFEIAQLVEDFEIDGFEITLDSWVILPNLEAAQVEWENQDILPEVEESGSLESYYEKMDRQADEEVRELIESEELKGKIKALKKPKSVKEGTQGSLARGKKSPAEIRDEQRQSMENDFGGPCILCLEPDEVSKERLMELREMLREGLGLPSYFSPGSVYSWEFVDIDMGYRPLIPISKFDSFSTAMETAGRLKGLWGEPLKIDVKSLEVLSCKVPDEETNDDLAEYETYRFTKSERFSAETNQYATSSDSWGCNAKIMLVDEEIPQDEDANEKMIEQLLEEGEIGGGDISMDFTILDDEEEDSSSIEAWLDDDEDFDEGTQVIIGRTHFFTGDQRSYNGMPATSAVDAKDRALGEAGSVSGLARRRGAVSRKSNVWEDGEYGRRTKDHLPWGLRERPGKDKMYEEDDQ